MSARRLISAVSIFCALVLAAAAPSAQTPPQTPAQAPKITMEGYPAPGEPAKVALLSTGAEPRKALRYSIATDFKKHLDLTIAESMTLNVLGQALVMPVPIIKIGADVAVTKIAANGDISYSLAFTGMTLEGDTSSPIGSQLQAATAGISDARSATTMSSRGVTQATGLDVPDAALSTLLSQTGASIENLSIALPEEAVGVGAQWEVRQALVSGGPTQFQKATYEVTAIDGLTVTLKVSTTNSAPAQAVDNPLAAAAGGEMRLETLSSTGSGTIAIRLDSLVPTSTTDLSMRASMTMTVQGQALPVTANGKISIAVAPAKAP